MSRREVTLRGRTKAQPIDAEVEAAAQRVLARTFGGIHHVPYWRKRRAFGDGLVVTCHQGLETFDFSYLTLLVVAAHDECVRVEVLPGGPMLRLALFLRRSREGRVWERHPTMEQVLADLRISGWVAKP